MRIFLTGASGLIGGEVARRLVARGHRVTAAIHRNPHVFGNNGVAVAVDRCVPINLCSPGLGLHDDGWRALQGGQDLILHCAGTKRFDLSEAEYHSVNVAGTSAIVDLARAADLPLLLVSTAYVCGSRGGTIRERDPLPEEGFSNAYEASKAAAERLVAASGLRFAIARPSIVVGEHGTGAIRQFDSLYATFKLIARGRLRRIPGSSNASLSLVPIDHVAAGLVALAEGMDGAVGKRFHLVPSEPLPMTELAAVIGSYPQLTAPILVEPDDFDPATLPPRERYVAERIVGLYGSYFQCEARFDDSESRAVTRLEAPPADAAYLRRLIDHCIACGFLPGPIGHADSDRPTGLARQTPKAFPP